MIQIYPKTSNWLLTLIMKHGRKRSKRKALPSGNQAWQLKIHNFWMIFPLNPPFIQDFLLPCLITRVYSSEPSDSDAGDGMGHSMLLPHEASQCGNQKGSLLSFTAAFAERSWKIYKCMNVGGQTFQACFSEPFLPCRIILSNREPWDRFQSTNLFGLPNGPRPPKLWGNCQLRKLLNRKYAKLEISILAAFGQSEVCLSIYLSVCLSIYRGKKHVGLLQLSFSIFFAIIVNWLRLIFDSDSCCWLQNGMLQFR